MTEHQLNDLISETSGLDTTSLLKWSLEKFGRDRLILSSSLGLEDQVLTDMILKIDRNARILTLDTGRLFQESYDVIQESVNKYNFSYELYFPESKAVEDLVKAKGPNLFYQSIEDRKQCCHIRKIEPLKRALSTVDAWITGIRSDQAVTRSAAKLIEWDTQFNIFKVNPLVNWTLGDVEHYIKEHRVPYNKLHDQGFPSIGCAPCTRAVAEGEDVRSGRWWWEQPESKECGLHLKDGKLMRAKGA